MTANLRQRGNSWVVYFRVGGKQQWKSFKTREEAELYLRRSQIEKLRGEFRPPTRVTFKTAADEWLRHGVQERNLKPSTARDYRSAVNKHLIPAFGHMRLEQVTAPVIERWRSQAMAAKGDKPLPRRTAIKLGAILHGIFARARDAYGYGSNPVDAVARLETRYSGDFDFYSVEEVHALVRVATAGKPGKRTPAQVRLDEQDGILYLTAAFTGLRLGELRALRWRDVDFPGETIRVSRNFAGGVIGSPKSGKVRSVPMIPEVAAVLARLSQRDDHTGDDDLVFVGERGASRARDRRGRHGCCRLARGGSAACCSAGRSGRRRRAGRALGATDTDRGSRGALATPDRGGPAPRHRWRSRSCTCVTRAADNGDSARPVACQCAAEPGRLRLGRRGSDRPGRARARGSRR